MTLRTLARKVDVNQQVQTRLMQASPSYLLSKAKLFSVMLSTSRNPIIAMAGAALTAKICENERLHRERHALQTKFETLRKDVSQHKHLFCVVVIGLCALTASGQCTGSFGDSLTARYLDYLQANARDSSRPIIEHGRTIGHQIKLITWTGFVEYLCKQKTRSNVTGP